MDLQAKHEIEHGKMLATMDTERIWGWDTPAGRLRAERRAELIAQGANLAYGTRALEIGCGTGMFTEKFAKTGALIIAVDISKELLQKAIARNLPPEQVRFLEKRFEECDVDGPFDAVIGSSILHHLDTGAAFIKIYELLKPGGIMSFAEPNMLNPQVWAERKFRRWFPQVSPDETAFIRRKLIRTLENTGFENVKIVPFDWLHPSVPRILINAVLITGHILESLPVMREFSGSLYIRAARPLK